MRMALGLGIGLPFGDDGASPLTDPLAIAYVAAMAVKPPPQYQGYINTLAAALRAANVLGNLDGVYLPSNNAANSRLNFMAPGTATLNAINAPVFAAWRGWTGDAASSYLDSGWPFPAGYQNDAHLGVWSLSDIASSTSDAGNSTSECIMRTTTNLRGGRINSGTATTAATVSGAGHLIMDRTSSTTQTIYYNGGNATNGSVTSTAPGTDSVNFLHRNGFSYSPRQLSIMHFGKGLTGTQIAAIYSAFRNFLLSIGAIS